MPLSLAIIIGFAIAGFFAGGQGVGYRAAAIVGLFLGVAFVLFLFVSGAASFQELISHVK